MSGSLALALILLHTRERGGRSHLGGARNDLMGAGTKDVRQGHKFKGERNTQKLNAISHLPSHQPASNTYIRDFNLLNLALSLCMCERRRCKSFEWCGRSDSTGGWGEGEGEAKRSNGKSNQNRTHGNHNSSFPTDSIQALSKTMQGSHSAMSNCEWRRRDTWPLCGCVDKRVHESAKVKTSEIMRDEKDRSDRSMILPQTVLDRKANERNATCAQKKYLVRGYAALRVVGRRHGERRGNLTMQPI